MRHVSECNFIRGFSVQKCREAWHELWLERVDDILRSNCCSSYFPHLVQTRVCSSLILLPLRRVSSLSGANHRVLRTTLWDQNSEVGMTPFWPDVGEAGRCFVENARSTWAVASNSEIDFSIYKTQKRWAREVTRSATSTPRVPGGPPPRGANLSRTNRSRGRLHFRSNDRAHYPRISRLIIIFPIIREKYVINALLRSLFYITRI